MLINIFYRTSVLFTLLSIDGFLIGLTLRWKKSLAMMCVLSYSNHWLGLSMRKAAAQYGISLSSVQRIKAEASQESV